jgi:hypothetical protein
LLTTSASGRPTLIVPGRNPLTTDDYVKIARDLEGRYGAKLTVTEFMYSPPAPTAAEDPDKKYQAAQMKFVEVKNIGQKTVSMKGFRFTRGPNFNFTTSGQWMWDELQITVPPNQDPYPLLDAIQQTVAKETEANAQAAEKEWQNATSRYKVRSVSAAPTVNLRPTAAGVEVHVRYIARAQERSAIRTRLNQALVELLHHRGVDDKASFTTAK